jgi:chromosome segregation ATPase
MSDLLPVRCAVQKALLDRDAVRLGDSKLLARIQALEAELAEADGAADELEAELDQVAAERDSITAERDQVITERDALQEQLQDAQVWSLFTV